MGTPQPWGGRASFCGFQDPRLRSGVGGSGRSLQMVQAGRCGGVVGHGRGPFQPAALPISYETRKAWCVSSSSPPTSAYLPQEAVEAVEEAAEEAVEADRGGGEAVAEAVGASWHLLPLPDHQRAERPMRTARRR